MKNDIVRNLAARKESPLGATRWLGSWVQTSSMPSTEKGPFNMEPYLAFIPNKSQVFSGPALFA